MQSKQKEMHPYSSRTSIFSMLTSFHRPLLTEFMTDPSFRVRVAPRTGFHPITSLPRSIMARRCLGSVGCNTFPSPHDGNAACLLEKGI